MSSPGSVGPTPPPPPQPPPIGGGHHGGGHGHKVEGEKKSSGPTHTGGAKEAAGHKGGGGHLHKVSMGPNSPDDSMKKARHRREDRNDAMLFGEYEDEEPEEPEAQAVIAEEKKKPPIKKRKTLMDFLRAILNFFRGNKNSSKGP